MAPVAQRLPGGRDPRRPLTGPGPARDGSPSCSEVRLDASCGARYCRQQQRVHYRGEGPSGVSMNTLGQLKLHVEALASAVELDRKFFASVAHYVERLRGMLRGPSAGLTQAELRVLADKLEAFWVKWRPSGDGFYLPPRQASDTDDTVRDIGRLANDLCSLDEQSFALQMVGEVGQPGQVATPPRSKAIEGGSMRRSDGDVQQLPRVFVVHGHDEMTLTKLEDLLLRIGCKPITFKRLESKGARTNIEILEKTLPECEAVVVLMTPDDEGRKKAARKLQPRARQNVLVEAGYAVIQRRPTSIIVALGDIEIPTDLDGINRVQRETWDAEAALDLARRLKGLGLPVDLNAL